MSIFSKIKAALVGSGKTSNATRGYTRHDGQGLFVYIRCDRCGEVVPLRLRKTDEMARSEEEGYDYFVQKIVMGTQCFARMDTRLEFDRRHEIVNSSIQGGSLITVKEYDSISAN